MRQTLESQAGLQRMYLVATLGLILVAGAMDCYRAATQPYQSAERALHWNLLVERADQPSVKPSKRGLSVIASDAVVKTFGLSAFTLRIPDLAGGLLYLGAILLLCRLVFGDSLWLLSAVALNTLNPVVAADCWIAAGRGLGLGFWTLGAYFVVRWVADGRRIPIAAGVALGLAAASDPQQAAAVAALDVAFIAGVLLSRLKARNRWGAIRFVVRDAMPFCLTSAAVAVAFLLRRGDVLLVDRAPGGTAFIWWALSAALLAGLCFAAGRTLLGWMRWSAADRMERLLMLFAGTAVATAGLVWRGPPWNQGAYVPARWLAQPLALIAIALFLRWASAAGAGLSHTR